MKDMDDLGNKISEISAKLNCSIEAHLVESIISLFNQGVLVRRLHSPRMLIDKDNFTMSVEQAQSVRFEGREKIIQLQVENSELKRKLDLAVETVEFYADKENWQERVKNGTVICAFNCQDTDDRESFFDKTFCGKRARQALKEIRENIK